MALQAFDFTDDSDIDVVFGDETITLHYDADLDDLATVSTDRANGVPEGGQVHVTVSDFRLNLDPTGADAWIMNADGTFDITCALTTPTEQLAMTLTMTEGTTTRPPLAARAESSQLPK